MKDAESDDMLALLCFDFPMHTYVYMYTVLLYTYTCIMISDDFYQTDISHMTVM